MRSGELQKALSEYKFAGILGWAYIFARILVGFLDERAGLFQRFDLIVASPTFVGEGGRSFDHTREVLAKAAEECGEPSRWPFDRSQPPAIVRLGPTGRMTGAENYQQRRVIGEEQLRSVLKLTEPNRTRDRSILVYDDVFTTGLTLNEVARLLRVNGGARVVYGVSLCRQPFRG
jgi:predicted amidophosphoribosyltransferase